MGVRSSLIICVSSLKIGLIRKELRIDFIDLYGKNDIVISASPKVLLFVVLG